MDADGCNEPIPSWVVERRTAFTATGADWVRGATLFGALAMGATDGKRAVSTPAGSSLTAVANGAPRAGVGFEGATFEVSRVGAGRDADRLGAA